MELAVPLPLDTAGQPVLQADEVRYRMQDGVALYDRDAKRDDLRDGIAIVTSHRVCWVDPARRRPLCWHLSRVVSVAAEEGTMFVGHPRIVVTLSVPPTAAQVTAAAAAAANAATASPLYPALPGGGGSGTPAPPSASSAAAAVVAAGRGVTHFKLSFHRGGRDAALEDLQKAVARKAWEAVAASPPAEATPKPEDVVARPGIGGLLERRAKAQAEASAATSAAFADLDELAKHARTLVAMAESYAAEAQRKLQLQQQQQAGLPGGGSGGSSSALSPLPPPGSPTSPAAATTADADVSSAGSLALSMGLLSSPITRSSAGGGLFFSELARQVAAFIRPYLTAHGGLAPLSDVYVVYNRARRTDLVSPDDLLEAAGLMATLGLGLHLRTLGGSGSGGSGGSHGAKGAGSGGLKVLQLDSFSDEAAGARIAALLRQRAADAGLAGPLSALPPAAVAQREPYVTALELNTLWRVPLPVAQRLLQVSGS